MATQFTIKACKSVDRVNDYGLNNVLSIDPRATLNIILAFNPAHNYGSTPQTAYIYIYDSPRRNKQIGVAQLSYDTTSGNFTCNSLNMANMGVNDPNGNPYKAIAGNTYYGEVVNKTANVDTLAYITINALYDSPP